ncbi:hypothetical protein SDC9_210563 [bioreactor metagenome]|uniref:Uncharacterized protein n=1 Tax=bioreactor metagenome TaxID=1076179 RepID=A0A645JI75_9ZZZZ
MIVTENGWLYLLICVAMSLLIYYFCRISRKFRKASVSGKESRPHVNFTAAVYGFLAMLAPVTPFLIIANPWFSLRSTAASIVGAAVLIDLLFRMLIRNKRRTFAAVCAAFSLVSLIAAASETYDYMKTYELDKIVLRETEKAVKSGAASGKTEITNA